MDIEKQPASQGAHTPPDAAPDTSATPAPLEPTPSDKPRVTQRELLLALAIGAVVLATMLGVLMARDVPAKDLSAISGSPVSPTSAPRAEGAAGAAVAVVKWSGANRAVWVGNRKNGVAYEVAAENTVNIWMRTVRPVLVVRCIGGATEVFVITESATQMEAQTEDHTVGFTLDNGAETKELWPDSTEHDALFAPDGAAFARRLMAARTMQFRFTPHNAPPAVARFAVGGLDQLLAGARKECGWK